MAGVALLMAQGGHIATNLAQTMRVLLTFDQTTVRDAEPALIRFKETIFNALWSLAPLLAGLALVALFVPMLVGGWNLTFKAIEPKFSKLNPLPGVKRMFSVNAATEALKAILKSVLIGGIATWFIWRERAEIIGLISMPLPVGIAKMTDMIISTFFVVTSAMILLVAIDVPFQLWSYHRSCA